MIVGIATAVSAQQTPAPSQQEIERIQQQYQDQLRSSTLIGPYDDLSIELPNGELIPAGIAGTWSFMQSRTREMIEQGPQPIFPKRAFLIGEVL